jgi:hypothetical protein
MNQKAILALIAIIATVGILIIASSIATPASAVRSIIVREKDTKSNPNSAERTSIQESDSGHHQPPG